MQPRWSAEEAQMAATMWQNLFVDVYGDEEGPRGAKVRVLQRISAEIGRSFDAVENRLNSFGPSFGSGRWKAAGASAITFAERAARADAMARRDLTGRMMGDPPPGYSALDQRRPGAGGRAS